MIVETIDIIRCLRDRADRADNLGLTRIMHTAADRLCILEKQLEMARAERDAVTKRMIELEQMTQETREGLQCRNT